MSHYTGAIPNTTSPNVDWRDAAVCREEDPELFFPNGHSGPWELVIEEAKAVCRRCPVLDACLAWALDNRVEHGVWGGLSEKERHNRLRQAARRRHQEQALETRPAGEAMQAIFAECTAAAEDGHVLWVGEKTSVYVGDIRYTFAQLAFQVGYERAPMGQVQRSCDRLKCVAREHLTDGLIRAQLTASA